uniref:ABC transporter domain-containing protein n=1 Tax=Biomphalaria glabrata TaxID=6526 RepID=A0A2C9K2I2_BIOGL
MNPFPALLRDLEARKDQLDISSYEILTTSLKDVLLGVWPIMKQQTPADNRSVATKSSRELTTAAEKEEEYGAHTSPSKHYHDERDQDMFNQMVLYERPGYFKHRFRQMKALFSMRCMVFLRNKNSTVLILSIPVAYTLLGMLLDYHSKPVPKATPVMLGLEDLPASLVYPIIFHNLTISGILQKYMSLLQGRGRVVEYFVKLQDLSNTSLWKPYLLLQKKYPIETLIERVRYTLAHILSRDDSEHFALYIGSLNWKDKPLALQLFTTAWIQCVIGEEFSLQGGVRYHSSSLRRYPREVHPWSSGTVLFSVMFMALVSLPFTYSLIVERNATKRLQIMNGVSIWMYWLGQFLFDITFYGIMVIPHLVALFFFSEQDWWMLSVGVMSLYGLTLFPYLYALQFFFRQPVTGVGVVLMVNVFIGVLGALVMSLHSFRTEEFHNEMSVLDIVFRLTTPNYGLTFFLQIATYISHSYVSYSPQPHASRSDHSRTTLSKYFLEYIVTCVVQMTLCWSTVAFLEMDIYRRLSYWMNALTQCQQKPKPETEEKVGNDNIQQEKVKVDSNPDTADTIIVSHVTKNYDKCFQDSNAVEDACLLIGPYDCVGLVGPNGAGKSLILQMISGTKTITSGDIYVDGFSVKTHLNSICPSMVHCQQTITLAKLLTGKETLVFYARLKGIPGTAVQNVVLSIIHFVSLSLYENTLIKKYSDSSKRKLLLGVCLLSFPKFIILDYPTSGVDILGRDKMLTLFELMRSQGCTILMTSDSVGDCEGHCSRVAIVRNGSIVTLDEPQKILYQQGQGYVLTLHALDSDEDDGHRLSLEQAEQLILSALPTSQILTKQEELTEIHMPNSVEQADMYETLIKGKSVSLFGHFQVQRLSISNVICSILHPICAMLGYQLNALLWKNFLLQLRSWKSLLVEICIPSFIFLLIVYIFTKKEIIIQSITAVTAMEIKQSVVCKILYKPHSPVIAELINDGSDRTTPTFVPVKSFQNITEYEKLEPRSRFQLGCWRKVEFDLQRNEKAVPTNLRFKVVLNNQYVTDPIYVHVTISLGSEFESDSDYRDQEVSQVQYVVTKMFINYWQKKRKTNKFVATEAFYTSSLPERITISPRNQALSALDAFFPFLYIGLAVFAGSYVVEEKESRLKEAMKLMGLKTFSFWFSWFLTSFKTGFFICLLFMIFLKWTGYTNGNILSSSSGWILLFMIIYAIDAISFSFMLTCFINKARNFVICAVALYFSLTLGAPILSSYLCGKVSAHVGGLLFFQFAAQHFKTMFINFEWREVGVISEKLNVYEVLPYLHFIDTLIMFITNTLFNCIIIWYVSNIFPEEYGVPQPYNFFLKKSYWCPPTESEESIPALSGMDERYFQPASKNLTPGIQIRGLIKVFDRKVVVAGIDLDLFEDQITVLLGHNGAGKTTTINMLTGFLKPTKGTAIVNGIDLTKNLTKAVMCNVYCVFFA